MDVIGNRVIVNQVATIKKNTGKIASFLTNEFVALFDPSVNPYLNTEDLQYAQNILAAMDKACGEANIGISLLQRHISEIQDTCNGTIKMVSND